MEDFLGGGFDAAPSGSRRSALPNTVDERIYVSVSADNMGKNRGQRREATPSFARSSPRDSTDIS